jgi:hypothetical protein
MKKAANKTRRKGRKKVSSGTKTHKPADLEAIRKEITGLVGDEAISMVETTMAEVEKGHYAAMKFLFEMIGLYPATGQEEAVGTESVAHRLVRRLGLPEEPKLDTEVTNDSIAEQVAVAGDAVE